VNVLTSVISTGFMARLEPVQFIKVGSEPDKDSYTEEMLVG
jgi:hypothetical protein